jgi:hypothetical protein
VPSSSGPDGSHARIWLGQILGLTKGCQEAFLWSASRGGQAGGFGGSPWISRHPVGITRTVLTQGVRRERSGHALERRYRGAARAFSLG